MGSNVMQGNKKFIRVHFLYAIALLLILLACTHSSKQNRLSRASSPYLLEHADNPVDWYEWGDEALSKAKKENKPLLVSIGYASCHWCHVMEKESFMDTGVARIMNENFINIKVDREERPDIDNIYMNACQLLTGGGGWPLNAFALPDGKPFFAGTYYEKDSWINLLGQISKAYKEQNKKVVLQADALTNGMADTELSFSANDDKVNVVTKESYTDLFDSIYASIDTLNGGIKGVPKFPMPSIWEFMLQYQYLTGNKKALKATEKTLRKMASGGIYDQVGGGFARYSTDNTWHIPHFEKMLYDNGQLMSLYAHAFEVTGDDFFKNIVEEVASFIERDLTSPGGGFYSSLNADTDKGEGEFYAWSYNEIMQIFGEKRGELVAAYFNISPGGNWEATKSILYTSKTAEEFAADKDISVQEVNNLIATARKILLQERNKRSKPSTDDKILTSWNALVLKSYADAYAALGNDAYLQTALRNAAFIEKNMLGGDGHLFRSFRNGKASVDGFLEDYALLARAYIRLYQVTFDKHWLVLANNITEYTIKNFFDSAKGMFYYTSSGSESLAVRKIVILDEAIPSSNAIMAEVLYLLGTYFEKEEYLEKSKLMHSAVAGKAGPLASYYSQWCYLAGIFSYGTYEVAVMGKEAGEKNRKLQKHYLPNCILMGETDKENLPLLENKLPENNTLIYVCTNRTCKLPVEDVDKALLQIR